MIVGVIRANHGMGTVAIEIIGVAEVIDATVEDENEQLTADETTEGVEGGASVTTERKRTKKGRIGATATRRMTSETGNAVLAAGRLGDLEIVE